MVDDRFRPYQSNQTYVRKTLKSSKKDRERERERERERKKERARKAFKDQWSRSEVPFLVRIEVISPPGKGSGC